MKHTTTSFYVPPEFIQNGRVKFPEQESQHLVKVLRAAANDEVSVIDGEGNAYWVKIIRADAKFARGEILREAELISEPNIHFTLGIGTIKPARLETAWDCCVQIGISNLVPLFTDYGMDRIKPDGRFAERLRMVSIRAMKQSRRAILPTIQAPCKLHEHLVSEHYDSIFIADTEGLPNFPVEIPPLGSRILLLVGPEGGFSAEERRIIFDYSGIPISLGRRRLRAETAAIAMSTLALRWIGDI